MHFNDSLRSGVFPDRLKLAKVIPLHKKGATDNPSNYRRILQRKTLVYNGGISNF